jgi:hypothetical protein
MLSEMRRGASNIRWRFALFVAFALLFSPRWDNVGATGSARENPRDLEARVLAPTVRDALIGAPQKLAPRGLFSGERSPRLALGSLAVAALVLAATSLLWVRNHSWARVESRPSLLSRLVRNPRSPPTLQTT